MFSSSRKPFRRFCLVDARVQFLYYFRVNFLLPWNKSYFVCLTQNTGNNIELGDNIYLCITTNNRVGEQEIQRQRYKRVESMCNIREGEKKDKQPWLTRSRCERLEIIKKR